MEKFMPQIVIPGILFLAFIGYIIYDSTTYSSRYQCPEGYAIYKSRGGIFCAIAPLKKQE